MRKRAIAIFLLGFMLYFAGSMTLIPESHQPANATASSILSQGDDPILIIGNSELSQSSSGGVGTRSEPYLISGLTISSTGTCISIQDTTAFFIILDCDLESTTRTVSVVIFNNVEHGIIENCYIEGGLNGAYLLLSTDCTVKDSTFLDNSNGIQLDRSENCTISDCNSFSNTVGILISNSRSTTVVNSSIYSNSMRGISIILYSEDTTIFQNNIGWNTFNAFNDANTTEFTNGIDTGNAWSDYQGLGNYEIPGSFPVIDIFATVLSDTQSPAIDSPLDKVFDVESYGETLTWMASDDFALSYILYIDDVSQGSEPWDGREITISLDTLSTGTHMFVLTVFDASINEASDGVEVTAVSFMLGGIGTELVMWSSALTVAILVLVVVIAKKMP
ncbi:MAG: right-handed parallel beta-helix repeat-containing protein [Candidatus Thorarchaeota archaeon]|nr:right-handed parallel beta-helix repeat-containing protein [Candidatus Thorarchaeota archaeon]